MPFSCSDNPLWSVTAKSQTVADGKKLRLKNKDLQGAGLCKENGRHNKMPAVYKNNGKSRAHLKSESVFFIA